MSADPPCEGRIFVRVAENCNTFYLRVRWLAPANPSGASRRMKTQLTDRQAARRDRVIRAAMDLASTGGYDAVQMREVAANADVALGTLYRYFSSKDQLLVAVLSHWAGELRDGLVSRPPRGHTPAERVIDVLQRATRAMERAPQLTSAVVTALSSLSADDPPGLEATREVYDVGTDIITTAMHDGD